MTFNPVRTAPVTHEDMGTMPGPPGIELAIAVALLNHHGQVDKLGAPYILHVLRVMLQMETEEEMMVAVLHDVLEGTPVTEEYLRNHQYPDPVVDAVVCLTRKKEETYKSYIKRCGSNSLARRVKHADLLDHLEDTTALSQGMIDRYNVALCFLGDFDR
jgi:(p)ppGpp synthase/HD superfamily hydrolase